jgi:methionyl-tRNA formyltransferase
VRVVFFGTPEPAAIALEELLRSRHEVAAAVTQPDRPRGRSGEPQPSPVKLRAMEAGLDVLQPLSPRDDGFAAALADYRPDACAVVAYGHILPPEVIAVPHKGIVNVHFSLLPSYRGAAPAQRAIMAGERETGVTTFLIEKTLDTGPILLQERLDIEPDDTAGTLLGRLAPLGARLLVATLDGREAGTLQPRPQDPARASPAPKIKPEEGAVDWTRDAVEIVNLVRGLNPAPGAYASFRAKRLKIWRAGALEGDGRGPGTVVDLGPERLGVAAGRGVVELLEVQLEGSKRLDAASFARGHRPTPGETLDSTGPGPAADTIIERP